MFSPLFITGKNTVDVYNPYAWGSVKLLPVIFNPNHRSKFLVKLTSSSMAIQLPTIEIIHVCFYHRKLKKIE